MSQKVSLNAGFPEELVWLLVKLKIETPLAARLKSRPALLALNALPVKLTVEFVLSIDVIMRFGLDVPVSVICQAMMSDWDNVPN